MWAMMPMFRKCRSGVRLAILSKSLSFGLYLGPEDHSPVIVKTRRKLERLSAGSAGSSPAGPRFGLRA